MIYHTRGKQANHYTTDEPMIYHTRGEQANHYTTDEPMIYHTRGQQANHYTTDALFNMSRIINLNLTLHHAASFFFVDFRSRKSN
jgi:hypothetical protein